MANLYRLIHGKSPNKNHALSFPKIPYLYDYLNTKYYPAWRQHDADYRYRKGRKTADKVMRDTVISLSGGYCGIIFAWVCYFLVRLFGSYHYYVKPHI